MSRTLGRIQALMLDPRTMRALVLFVGAGVALYLAAMFWFGWKDAAVVLTALGVDTLLIGAVLASTAYLWRFARWEYALRRFGCEVPRWRHLAIYLSGLALTATPGKSGETFRSALLVQQGVKVSHSLAAFIVDRATDVLGMCLLGVAASWALGQEQVWFWLLAFCALLLGSGTVAYFLSHPNSGAWWGWLDHMCQWLPVKGGRAVLESWAFLWKWPRIAAFSVVAMIAYGTQALVFAWFCHIAGTGITAAECALIFVQATLFGAASMIPGGLGAMEAALVVQMTERGVGNGAAVSLAIAIRLVTLWLGMAIGSVSLLSSVNKEAASQAAK